MHDVFHTRVCDARSPTRGLAAAGIWIACCLVSAPWQFLCMGPFGFVSAWSGILAGVTALVLARHRAALGILLISLSLFVHGVVILAIILWYRADFSDSVVDAVLTVFGAFALGGCLTTLLAAMVRRR
ncbi:hypothetical protein [Embleya sp. AB8]|uniref:hypothetical protein n=1 Tax=Embleya sp. AB8 TaxID=3156304 RepID=UPI003C741A9F